MAIMFIFTQNKGVPADNKVGRAHLSNLTQCCLTINTIFIVVHDWILFLVISSFLTIYIYIKHHLFDTTRACNKERFAILDVMK